VTAKALAYRDDSEALARSGDRTFCVYVDYFHEPRNDPNIVDHLRRALQSERFLRDRETEVLRRELSEAREGAP
jgi:hypothetical protein